MQASSLLCGKLAVTAYISQAAREFDTMQFSDEFYLIVQVNGINQLRLGALRPHLMVGNAPDGAPGNTLSNGAVISTPSQNSSQHMNGKPLGGYILLEIVL